LLEEQGLDADLVQAVAGETVAIERVLRDPADARQRAELLAQLRASGELAAVQAVVTRAARLAEKGDLGLDQISPSQLVQPELFEQPSEEAMLEVLQQLEPIAGGSSSDRYQLLIERLASSAPTLAAFFDGDQSVMVMADNLEIRRNRLNLLALLRNQAAVLADFSRISG
jgi:glycyl-tRNA synthetase beta chain